MYTFRISDDRHPHPLAAQAVFHLPISRATHMREVEVHCSGDHLVLSTFTWLPNISSMHAINWKEGRTVWVRPCSSSFFQLLPEVVSSVLLVP